LELGQKPLANEIQLLLGGPRRPRPVLSEVQWHSAGAGPQDLI